MTRLPAPPSAPRPAARPSFPIIAVAAPLLGAVAIGFITGSPYVLMFAVLSPIVAIATVLDGRRSARRHVRDEIERFDRECLAYERAIERAHALERAEADSRAPCVGGADALVVVDATAPLRVGTAPAPSAAAPDELPSSEQSAADDRRRVLVDRARVHPQLPVIVPRGTIAVLGRGLAAEAMRRRLAIEPGVRLLAPPLSGVASDAVLGRLDIEPGAVVIDVRSATTMVVTTPGTAPRTVRPEFASGREIEERVRQRENHTPPEPPTAVRWSLLTQGGGDGSPHRGAPVPIGRSAVGIEAIDLVLDGPHALVGGTTGSGKSEFLRSLALGWAAHLSPDDVQLLFVDFKGGSTFSGLTELPHAVGLITDLDPLSAERALRSLRAELRRRERMLAERGARDIVDLGGALPRLLVLVDEFATLIDTFPELHPVFADLSARGRSLGVHLVLCTQHPAGAVRDAVAANCAIRVSFRTTGSTTESSSAEGGGLRSAPPGRAVIVDASGVRSVQIAVVEDDDVRAVRERWKGHPPAAASWLPALPAHIAFDALAALGASDGLESRGGDDTMLTLRFGVLDDPDQQRRLPALWRPARDGALAILGAARSGRSTALAALAAAAGHIGRDIVLLPPEPVDAWRVLDAIERDPVPGSLLLADDLDRTLADAGDLGPHLLARWDSAVRALMSVRGDAAAAAGSATAARSMLVGRFESRVVLRGLDADDHALAGGPRGLFDRAAPPGRGWWADRQLQVGVPAIPLPSPSRVVVPLLEVPVGADLLVVTRRPGAVTRAIRAAHPELVLLDDPRLLGAASSPAGSTESVGTVSLDSRILVADPESWQAAWSAFSEGRRRAIVIFAAADPADVRALIGSRESPPPLDGAHGDVWVCPPGEQLSVLRWPALAAG